MPRSIAEILASYEAAQKGQTGDQFVGPLQPEGAAPPEPVPSPTEKKQPFHLTAGAALARTLGPWVGAAGGAAMAGAGTLGFGAGAGAVAGGALGGAAGETIAEWLEGRESFSPAEIGVEAGFGAIPAGKLLKAGRPLLSGLASGSLAAGHAAAADVAKGTPIEEAVTPSKLALPAMVGGAVGGITTKVLGPKMAGAAGKPLDKVKAAVSDQPTNYPVTDPRGFKARLTKKDPLTGDRVPPTPEEIAEFEAALETELGGTAQPLTTILEKQVELQGKMKKLQDLLGSDQAKAQKAAAADIQALDELTAGQTKVQADELKRLEQAVKASAEVEKTDAKMAQAASRRERLKGALKDKVYVPPAAVSESISEVDPATGAVLRTGGTWVTPKTDDAEIIQEAIKAPVKAAPKAAAPATWQEALESRMKAEASGDRSARDAAWKSWTDLSQKMERAIAPKLAAGQALTDEEGAFLTDLANRVHEGDLERAAVGVLTRVVTGPKYLTKAEVGPALKQVDEYTEALKGLSPEKRKIALELIKSEAGGIDPELAMRLGLHGTGALIGAGLGAAASEEEDKVPGAIMGGLLGGAAPLALPKDLGAAAGKLSPKNLISGVAQRLPDIYRFNLLANPWNLGANVFGSNMGLATTEGLEQIFGGNVRQGAKLLKEVPKLPWKTITKGPEAYGIMRRHPEFNIAELSEVTQPTNVADFVIAGPATAIAAGDVALKEAAEKAGYSTEKAMELALASEPINTQGPNILRSWGQRLLESRQPTREAGRNYLMEMLYPFVRTGANAAIATPTRIPGVGLAVNAMMDPTQRFTAGEMVGQQATGSLVAATAYELGRQTDPENAKLLRPWVRNMAGKYGTVALAAFEAGRAHREGEPGAAKAIKAGVFEAPLSSGQIIPDLVEAITSTAETGAPRRLPGGWAPTQVVQAVNEWLKESRGE